MQKKVLFVATVDSHIRFFHLPYLQYFKEKGYEVHVATNGEEKFPYCDVKHQVPMVKSPFHLCNIKAYQMLKQIIKEEGFSIIHCHMPVGGALTRLAAKGARKSGTKVIYTAHGFHFYKGAPPQNWLLYYPVEEYLARYTDCLITINQEDYELARRKFKAKQIKWIKGVGIDFERFKIPSVEEKKRIRKAFNYTQEDFILMYVAEISKRKNQIMLIEVISKLKESMPQIKLILAGKDSLDGECQRLIEEKNLMHQIQILGERQDVEELLALPDLYISVSKQEGLPINILEAMASGLTVCATPIRGHVDLIKNGENGYLFKDISVESILEQIREVSTNYEQDKIEERWAYQSIQEYSKEKILNNMALIYQNIH